MLVTACYLVPLGMATHFCLLLRALLLGVARIPAALPELPTLRHFRLRGPVQLVKSVVQDVLLPLRLHCLLRHANLALVRPAEVSV